MGNSAFNDGVIGITSPDKGGTGIANNVLSTITITGAYPLALTLSASTSLTLPTSGTVATTSNKLSAFAATTSAELAGVISDETGTGVLVFNDSPAFTTKINVTTTSQNDAIGIIQAENTTASIANASLTAKNYYGTSQFMQWENIGLRIGNRITTNAGAGHVNFTSGNDSVFMTGLAGGNVGIGITTPSEKLHVFGNILASGDVNASNVNVDNVLINGGFDIFQRIQSPSTETAITNNVYGPDRWYVMTDGSGSDIQYSRQGGDVNSLYSLRIKQANASAKKWAVAQVIEASNTVPLRNRAVRFQARIKSSATPNMRMAILEWSGAVDAMGSARDLINAWANSADANPATTFFKSTSITVRANIAATATSGSFADFSVTATVGATANNLIVVFWTPSAIAQNVSVDFAEVGLYQGTNAKGWYPRPVAQELAMCQRYCYQMWRDNFGRLGGGSADTTNNVVVIGTFPVTMRTTPTLASSTASNFSAGSTTLASFNIAYTTNDLMAFNATTTLSVLVVGVYYQLVCGVNNSFLRFEAEL